MELILKADVPGLGFKDDIVKVKNGYGRNYLIPKGFALMATVSSKKVLAENIRQRAFKEKKDVELAELKVQELSKLKIKIKSKVAIADKLFGSVGAKDLVLALSESGHELSIESITIPGRNIKRIGSYSARVRLHREVSFDLQFEVAPQ
ncbi:MAG: 50S ribosomal protein L9 [Flavobacteriaceae bacterium]|nr:50S ribosomal protein L9 [Flavobacteriaceae bacterium]